MHDALLRGIHIEQPDTEFLAVGLQRGNLLRRNQIGDGSSARLGRNVVIHSGNGAQRLPHTPSRSPQSIKRLG